MANFKIRNRKRKKKKLSNESSSSVAVPSGIDFEFAVDDCGVFMSAASSDGTTTPGQGQQVQWFPFSTRL